MNKIQIKNRYTEEVIFEHEEEENTIKKTVEKAVRDGVSLAYADLSYADLANASLANASLAYADLANADLANADLAYANLAYADLANASLAYADLDYADLAYANLANADLSYADLANASLANASLAYANLAYADLANASLANANLANAKNIPFFPLACPSNGAFTAWKKVRANGVAYLVELYIPTEARRSSATTNKCRCDKAKVISITRIDNGEEVERVTNIEHAVTTYEVGCMVTPDSFDENRWDECSHGIHFFINKQEAINY